MSFLDLGLQLESLWNVIPEYINIKYSQYMFYLLNVRKWI